METQEGDVHPMQEDTGSDAKDTSPISFFKWIQSIRTGILSGASTRLPELVSALDEKRKARILTTEEAHLRGILALYLLTQESVSESSSTSPQLLAQALQVHKDQTFDAGATALNVHAFQAFSSLLLHCYYSYNRIAPVQNELTINTASSEKMEDILEVWTNIKGGPRLFADGRYADIGPIHIPTKDEAVLGGGQLEWDNLLSTSAVRETLRDVNSRVSGHITHSQQVWALYHQFEMSNLPQEPSADDIFLIQNMYTARLRTPHVQIDVTAQSYSTFVSTYLPSSEYEKTLSAAYNLIGAARSIIQACEPCEANLQSFFAASSSSDSPSVRWVAWREYTRWASDSYVKSMNRKKSSPPSVDVESVCSIYERAIESCGFPPSCEEELLSFGHAPIPQDQIIQARGKEKSEQRRQRKEQSKQVLQADLLASSALWRNYIGFLNTAKVSPTIVFDVCSRAVRSVPASGTLQGLILRTYCRLHKRQTQLDEIFSQALESKDLVSDVDSLVELLLARVDIERMSAAESLVNAGQTNDLIDALALVVKSPETFMNVYGVIMFALEVLDGNNLDDESLRLELLLTGWCIQGPEGTLQLAESRWDTVLRRQPHNSLASLSASRYHARQGNYRKARHLLKQVILQRSVPSDRKIEAAEELRRLEHTIGSVPDIEWAITKVDSERERSWTEYYARYSAQQPEAASSNHDLEMTDTPDGSEKRKAATIEKSSVAQNPIADKRGRQGDVKVQRDRENSSIIVDNLHPSSTQEDVLALFKDCGSIFEIIGPKVLDSKNNDGQKATALIEFVSRDSVPTSRSRQGKNIDGYRVDISLGWECTLYVTNFPASLENDEAIREKFNPFGRIFDVRWPSKKFASSRRFCYVVFCNAEESKAALQLHGLTLATDQGPTGSVELQVLISDPNRRKTRSDAFNDEKELYVRGLQRGASEEDIRQLFGEGVQNVRLLRHPDGRPKGLAFVDMRTALDAQRVVAQATEQDGGGYRIKGKLLSVSFVEKQQNSHTTSEVPLRDPGLDSRLDLERRSRCVQIRRLPLDAQEAIIQQIVELEYGPQTVKRVEWTPGEAGHGIAIVEFHDATIAGKFALNAPLSYDGHPLEVRSLESKGAAARMPISNHNSSEMSFAPRQAGGLGKARRRGGIGSARKQTSTSMDIDSAEPKNQDAFRAMLGK